LGGWTSSKKYQCLEVTDYATIRLKRGQIMRSVLAKFFPHPLRYKKVWSMSRGDKSLFAWKAVPPEGFVAMGMLCTVMETPPSIDAMRCVPLAWCVPSKVVPSQIWNDTGAGGGKPGSMWVINSLDMVAVIAGHEQPKETFYELNAARFFLENTKIKAVPTISDGSD
jgi:hypothetical protein